jgi:CRP/FNR family transcriptional regulator
LKKKLTATETLPGESPIDESPAPSVMHGIALSTVELKKIYAYSRPMELRKKQILYFQGDGDDRLYILMEGAVKLTKVTNDGREYIMDIIGENSVFEQILDFETPGNDTAVVMEDGLVNVLDSKGHERLSNKAPQLSARLKRIIYLRRERRERKTLDLLNRTVEQRLAKVFISLREDFGVPRNGGFLLKAELTHHDLAGLIASTRETVTLKLNKLIKDNLIEYEGKYILVRSLREIRGLAN